MIHIVLAVVMLVLCYWGLVLYDKAPGGVNPQSVGAVAVLTLAVAIYVYEMTAGGVRWSGTQVGRFLAGIVSLLVACAGGIPLYNMWNSGAFNNDLGTPLTPLFGKETIGCLALMIAGICGVVMVLIKERKSRQPAGK
jgi:hypothetical protein